MRREDLADSDSQKVITTQLKDGVDVRVAFRDEFQATNAISSRDTNVPWDFAVYDEQIATEVFPQTGKFYGCKTNQSTEVEKYLGYYQLIEHSAQTVMWDGERLILATDGLVAS